MIDGRIERFFTSLPILYSEYPYAELLGAVNAIRRVRAENRGVLAHPVEMKELMEPERALMVSCAVLEMSPPPYERVTLEEQARIEDTLQELSSQFPSWSVPLSLQIVFLKLPDDYGAISGSAQKWPQHILLSREGLEAGEIAEQLIHEFCHQWQYLIQEILPSNKYSRDRTLKLPSGTPERAPSEVLGAGHVAATLVEYYKVADPPQVPPLLEYARGCSQLLRENSDRLSETGLTLHSSLERWLEGNA